MSNPTTFNTIIDYGWLACSANTRARHELARVVGETITIEELESEVLKYERNQTNCPTCGQPLETDLS